MKIGGVVHLVDLLAIAYLFFLRLGDGLRGGHPFLKPGNQCRMVGSDLSQHSEAEPGHGVEAYAFARSQRAKKLEHLRASIAQIAPGDVALVDQQDSGASLRRACCRSSGCGIDGAITEDFFG